MKFLKRFIIFLGVIFLSIVILLYGLFFYVKHLKIKDIVEHEIEEELGIKVSIKELELSPLLTLIGAKGVTIHNPAGFPDGELAYISSIYFVFDPVEVLIRKKPNIYLFALDLDRLNVVNNKTGAVNLKEIIPIKKETAQQDDVPFSFDVIILSIGDVYYTDYGAKGQKTHQYHIGIENQAFVNLEDESEVIRLIVYKALQNTDIGKLVNLTLKPIVSQVTGAVDIAWGTATFGVKSAAEIAALPFKLIFGRE
jgi:uncharacterized protein involved in outer membrane biogenesis